MATDERTPQVFYNECAEPSTEHNSKNLTCPRCGASVPDAPYCCQCGRSLHRKTTRKKRGNGQGTIVERNGKFRAVVTLGYWVDENGKLHRRTRSQTFVRKRDAVAALASLGAANDKPASITLRELFDRWEPTHKAGESTMCCYRSAFRYFKPLWFMSVNDISVDDLQECLDSCGKGRRTMENMRAVIGLVYKYGLPRKLCEMNLAPFLSIDAPAGGHRPGFQPDEIEMIRNAVGTVEGAEIILCMIYTGFRPSEFLALTGASYDKERGCLIGGAKTDAGRGRVVTVSPKIAAYIPTASHDAPLFGHSESLKAFTERFFYPVLAACGVPNPIIETNGTTRHKYTPHTTRHTFATLMKNAAGAEKDKLELIGHTSGEMLRYYQDVGIEDLRRITDQL